MFLTIRQALLQGTQVLEAANIHAPRLTAEVLLMHATQRSREWLLAHATEPLTELWWIHYGRYLHQRTQGVPTQYITGVQEFYGRIFRVTPDVLIPRPETEHLIDAVLARYTSGIIADIGAGSGAIAVTLALELPHAPRVVATDISAAALAVARSNRHGADVQFVQTDLLAAFASRSLAIAASNPPYIPETQRAALQPEVRDHEPHLALFSPEDGMAHIRRLVDEARRVLVPGGWLIFEIASDGLAKTLPLLEGYRAVEIIHDLAGHPRVVAARNQQP